jgi:hypothetical protein
MTNRWLFLVLASACTPRPIPPPPPPPGAYVDFEVHGNLPIAPTRPVGITPPVEKDQPAHIKLKLGHYRNHRFGIGVTIDLVSAATENIADIDPAKVRFDGESKVWLLEGRHGGNGRIDYVRERDRVMLQVSRDGRYTVYIPDPETDRATQAIDVHRDGDADPL